MPLFVTASESLVNNNNGYNKLDEMKKFDLVVTEPWAINDEQLRALHDAGVLVLGYIPTSSIDIQHPPFTGLEDNDFLWVNKHKVVNNNDISPDWIMDISNPHYRNIVLTTIKETIFDRGFDGVFLDTLNQGAEYLSCYVSLDPATMDELTRMFLEGGMHLCREIRALDNSKIIAQNNGWRELINFTAPHIDFLMWENYPYKLGEGDYWLNQKRNNLVSLSKKYGFKVLTSTFSNTGDYDSVKTFYNVSRSYGFVPYSSWTDGTLFYNNINTYDVPPRSPYLTRGYSGKPNCNISSFVIDLSGPGN